ncbi:octopamine receptor Oamb isoform X1 [Diorhabda sublineata]|uniref:octopamine receptor Oamb isoform X1 n=1 Tax=Diorhabda sublineata TaxID=1163346 RepID=UPI0024E0B27D|nr:octopamine receptor Oamb isoform X1 [Diorhabda sublineata]
MRNKLNESACAALLDEVNFGDSRLLLSLSVLAMINVMVIVGNCLVIAAVYYSSKLRSVTNFFIVSLAVADLMVGVAVLPFSATWEVFKVWIFGDIWCQVWLAVDVWMCTASILNLCAISLDRYVAVTRPITYPSIMSHSRAKGLIAGLWILSFVICFPPLVGWRDRKLLEVDYSRDGNSTQDTLTAITPASHCPWQCEITNEVGYVVYSALGSFYIPMFVMLFFYWRIYKAAVRTTRAINQGFRTTKGSRGIGNRFEEQRLTLRIHRGHGSSGKRSFGSPYSNESSCNTTTGSTSASPSPSTRGRHEKVKISVSHPSSENLSPPLLAVTPTSPTTQISYAVHYTANGKDTPSSSVRRPSASKESRGGNQETHLRVHRFGSYRRTSSRRSSSCDSTCDRASSPSLSGCEDGSGKKQISGRMGKRNIKAQVGMAPASFGICNLWTFIYSGLNTVADLPVKRFRMETKAAKTLGIIVGGFIFCWLPFFTMYLVRAFCHDCINPLLFSTLFWLGYCNSAINPLIYALFSKDFRFAFKRIICKCFCKTTNRDSRRGSDGSQLQVKHFRLPSYKSQNPGGSVGDDSDPIEEITDSR